MRLLLDVMLGRLANYLRLCGHDAAYALDRDVEADEAVLALARREDRRLVTRDRRLADRAGDAILLESKEYRDQLRELRAAGLSLDPVDPARCGRCNGPLERLPDDADRPAYVPDEETRVWRCRECGQLFWKGSHWDRMAETLAEL